eukprot:7779800-Pyramimonas_sp.AAC.1
MLATIPRSELVLGQARPHTRAARAAAGGASRPWHWAARAINSRQPPRQKIPPHSGPRCASCWWS